MATLIISTFLLCIVVTYALINCALEKPKPKAKLEWEDDPLLALEDVPKTPRDCALACGFDLENEIAITDDGFKLLIHRVVVPGTTCSGPAILLLHGLMQSSGCFIAAEERSLAFWLAAKGYKVFLGNTRMGSGMGHSTYDRSDARAWDWNVITLAKFDFPCMVKHVKRQTGEPKIIFIGHSQGAAEAFISLSRQMRPDVAKDLSLFVALAPAIYAGPLTKGGLFRAVGSLPWRIWTKVFGTKEFIPALTWHFSFIPDGVHGYMGSVVFRFLFDWSDETWLPRRRTKMFKFLPSPISSASLYWWAGPGGFADTGCILDESLPSWFDENFPPLSVYWGGKDSLVSAAPFLERLASHEKHVNLVKALRLDEAEHCDFFWAANAVEWCFGEILQDIRSVESA